MAQKNLRFKIQGVAPLILHNGHTADPLNYYAKEIKKISSKRSKTEADYEEMARLEWMASLYTKDNKIVIPGDVIQAMIESGAKKFKLGPKVKAGLFVNPVMFPLVFPDSERSLEELWKNDNYKLASLVRVQTSKVVRTRAKFDEWSVSFDLMYEDEILDKDTITQIIEKAGLECGFCDWRPRYGRFISELIK